MRLCVGQFGEPEKLRDMACPLAVRLKSQGVGCEAPCAKAARGWMSCPDPVDLFKSDSGYI